MKIGILTGGGDVPGLNPCIKAVVNRAVDEGHEVIGIRQGWRGLLHYNSDDEASWGQWLTPLDKRAVRTIDRTGGTFLHTSYLAPARVPAEVVPDFLKDEDDPPTAEQDFTAHILRNVEQLGLDVLLPIGGDETLNYAHRLCTEGVSIVAIPKTIENDVYGTDYCIGFSTGITRSINLINDLRTTVGSDECLGIVELVGRTSGAATLIAAYLADTDQAIIPEVPFDPEKLAVLLMQKKVDNPSGYAIVAVAEGASTLGRPRPLLRGGEESAPQVNRIGLTTSRLLEEITGEHTLYQQVAHLMRSGAPDSTDLMVGFNYANLAMDLVAEKKFGQMVALKDGKYTSVSASILARGIKRVDVDELYDISSYRPKIRHIDQKPMFPY